MFLSNCFPLFTITTLRSSKTYFLLVNVSILSKNISSTYSSQAQVCEIDDQNNFRGFFSQALPVQIFLDKPVTFLFLGQKMFFLNEVNSRTELSSP